MSETPSPLKVAGNVESSVVVVGDGNTVTVSTGHAKSNPNPFGVPYQRNRYFTGREVVLTQLHEDLTQSARLAISQVQAISGLGGIGKTQTAVEYAYCYHYDHRVYTSVFWVKSDTEVNLSTDFAAIANQLALPISGATQPEKVLAVQSWLSTHDSWLLIFDNADTPEWLTGFMPSNPKGKVLITSRASVFDFLGIRTPLALDVLSSEEGIALLFERTGYEQTKANIAAAAEINQELGGLPLALEQASAFIVRRKIGFAPYLKTYRKWGLSQLEKEHAKTGQYPSSVRRTWLINFEAVTIENAAAAALLEISAFLAPDEIPYCILTVGMENLETMLSAYLGSDDEDEALLALSELLSLLWQYSLVKWDSEEQIYSVHRLVQSVVRDAMTQSTANKWLEQVATAIIAAYPGEEAEHWDVCTQLLPHWLRIIQQAQQEGYESESLGTLLGQAGIFLEDQGRYSEAEPLYQSALAMQKRLLGDEHSNVAESINNLALLYNKQGRYSEAEPLYQSALAMRKRLLGDEHPDVAESINNLAVLYDNQGRYSEAEPLYQSALTMRKRLLGDEHPGVALSINNLAVLYHKQGRYSEAEPLYQSALATKQRLLGDEHPGVALSINNLAVLYDNQGRYSEAEPLYQSALTMRKRLLGDEHPDVALSLNNLAALYNKQGRYSEAEPLYQSALSMNKRLLGDEHPNVAVSLSSLAALYKNQGRYSEAEPLYQSALSMNKRLLGDEHPNVAVSVNNLAVMYHAQGLYNEAEPLFQSALVMRKRLLGDEHPDVAQTLSNLAVTYYAQGLYNEAEPLFQSALAMQKRLLSEEHPSVGRCADLFALLYRAQGNIAEAQRLHTEALGILEKSLGTNHPWTTSCRKNLEVVNHGFD